VLISTGAITPFIVVVSPCRCEPLRAGICCGGVGVLGVRSHRGKLIIIIRLLCFFPYGEACHQPACRTRACGGALLKDALQLLSNRHM